MDIVKDHILGLIGRQQTSSELDYVQDGVLHRGANAPSVMITAESDLALLPENTYVPGTIAYTAGFKAMWQLAADGTWVSLM